MQHQLYSTRSPKDTIYLTTPRGHEVMAELAYEDFVVRQAKVINRYTGIIHSLDSQTSETLQRALKAKQVYEHALAETRSVETTLSRFSEVALVLGNEHPAVQPYHYEAKYHRTIARDMYDRAQHFHDIAMAAIDKIAGD